jgi:hypothetical protein
MTGVRGCHVHHLASKQYKQYGIHCIKVAGRNHFLALWPIVAISGVVAFQENAVHSAEQLGTQDMCVCL